MGYSSRAARHLGRSASMKHRLQVPTKKQPWMRGAARVLAQAATGGNGPAAQVLLMKHVVETVQALGTVHEATKQHRRAQDLRLSLEHDLGTVYDAVAEPVYYSADIERAMSGTKKLTSEYLANDTTPMPTAIPETEKTPVEELGRDGFER